MDPKTLLVLLARRDMQAFGLRLTRRYRDLIDRDEVRSSVDLALLCAAERFDVTKGAFLPFATIWVKWEVRHLVRRELRWHRCNVCQGQVMAGERSDPCTEATDRGDLARVLEGDIDAIWRAHVGEGESLREIAQVYGLSLRQVQCRIARAQQRLRKRHAPWTVPVRPPRRRWKSS